MNEVERDERHSEYDFECEMKIRSHRELRVWQNAMDAAMAIFEETKAFPPEERYSMVDQMRRSSRSVAANISEVWRRRRYEAAFINKLNEAEGEASETQTWIAFSGQRYTKEKGGQGDKEQS